MPLTRTGIQNFYDQARLHGVARNNQLRVLKLGPNEYSDEIIGKNQIVFMTTASLPEVENVNHQLPYMGLDFNLPGTKKFPGSDSWSVTFRMPQDYGLRNILEKWNWDVFSPETSRGSYHMPCPDHTVELGLLNNAGKTVRQYTLIGVYIRSLGAVEYDVTGDGAPVTFDATFAYQWWQPSSPDSFGSGTGGVVDTITPIYDDYQNRADGNDACAS